MEGICRLCGKTTILLKESHIIPDFIYRDLKIFDHKHMHKRIEAQKESIIKLKVKELPSGEYEGGILCKKCDNEYFGSLESYAKKFMFGKNLPAHEGPLCKNYINHQGIEFTHCERFDYKKVKLFFLSILWRMTISTRPMFAQVVLPGNYEESLRKLLLDNNPGRINDFPIYGFTYLNDRTMPKDIIGQPFRAEVKGYCVIRMLIGGIFLLFHISQGFHDEEKIRSSVLNDSNEWNIFHIKKGKGWDFFFKHASI